jgi:hypothetical protein
LLEGGLEALHVDAEFPQQALADVAPPRIRRVDRLAAAVTDDQAAIEHEFVALGVAAKIVVVVEDEDAGLRPMRAAIEPGRGKPADTAADHHQIVPLLGRPVRDRKCRAVANEGMRGLERAGVLSAQPLQQWRIAGELCGNLLSRREAGGDGQRRSVDEIAPGDGLHRSCSIAERGRRRPQRLLCGE